MVGIGIDGCRSGWIMATASGSRMPRLLRLDKLEERVRTLLRHGALVDIPIGLPDREHPVRRCDTEARALLGPRRSSVFPAPSRAALAEQAHPEASEAHRRITGRGLSLQSWGIAPKIRDVDRLLLGRPELVGRLRESHPELAFQWLNGGEPLGESKRTERGAARRWALLEDVWPGVGTEARRRLPDLGDGAALDDVADALVLSHLARTAGRTTLPSDPPWDAEGLPREIVVAGELVP